ncbi:MAG: ABC transporter ATP-binding protein [Anaerolineae bacterium]
MADSEAGPLVALRSVSKTYSTPAGPVRVLADVSLSVQPGEFVGVVGPSGSGKSTLLNVVSGIDRPSSGEVWVGGTAVHTLAEESMAPWRGRNVGVVFQFFQLLPTLTIAENVMLPMDFCNSCPPVERSSRAMQLLDLVGIAAQADKLPHALSGGEQQRAAIARAMANAPPLIVADEPTGNLDSASASAILSVFLDLNRQGTTLLVVTHDRELASAASRVLRLSDGAVTADSFSPAGDGRHA